MQLGFAAPLPTEHDNDDAAHSARDCGSTLWRHAVDTPSLPVSQRTLLLCLAAAAFNAPSCFGTDKERTRPTSFRRLESSAAMIWLTTMC